MTVRGHAGKRTGDVQGSEWWGLRARLAARTCPWHHHFIPLFPLLLTALYKKKNKNHSGDLLAQGSLLFMPPTGRFSSCYSTQSDSARAGHCVHPSFSEPCSGRHGATGLAVCHSPSPILGGWWCPGRATNTGFVKQFQSSGIPSSHHGQFTSCNGCPEHHLGNTYVQLLITW